MTDFWTTALLDPLANLGARLLALLPNLVAMIIILTLGWALAWVSGVIVERGLRIVGLDRLSERLGATAALLRGGVKAEPSHVLGRAVYWFVLAFTVIAALAALNVEPINRFAQSFLAYIPHLFTAAIILVAGYLLSNFVGQAVLITAVNAGFPPARAVAAFSRWGVQLLAVAMALEQLGIAQNIVVVGFGITFGGVVLAAAIAFGLGAKDAAKNFLERRLSGREWNQGPDDLRHL
ncbi:mechanosensitive ion channel family protein [Candidatus Nitrospira bockiana]